MRITKGRCAVIGLALVALIMAVPAMAQPNDIIAYEQVDGVWYIGVRCSNGLEGRGTFLTQEEGVLAAVEYCNANR